MQVQAAGDANGGARSSDCREDSAELGDLQGLTGVHGITLGTKQLTMARTVSEESTELPPAPADRPWVPEAQITGALYDCCRHGYPSVYDAMLAEGRFPENDCGEQADEVWKQRMAAASQLVAAIQAHDGGQR